MKAALSHQWARLAPRERRALLLCALVVALALLWWLALAPAITTLRQAPAQHTRLDAELQHMQTLAAQAQALQAQPRVSRDEALRALELATQRHLGATARLSAVGDQATATFPSAEATALALWLADVRINARAVPVELRLSATTPPKAGTWQGSAVFALTR